MLIQVTRYAMVMLLLACIVAGVSAYEVVIDAPTQIQAGTPITVNGTTNLADGVKITITLAGGDYSTVEVDRKDYVIERHDENKSFSVVFNTTGLKKGQYKVEVLPIADFSFLGSSVTLRPVTLVDRSDEVVISPPLEKEYDGSLTIAGNDARLINSAVHVMVTSSNGTLLFGPEFLNTDYMGYFSKTFTIPGPGDYLVNISDARGFIGNFTYSITKPAEPLPAAVFGEAAAITLPEKHPPVSAMAVASRDEPAYFAVIANPGPVSISTSTGIDWEIEYLDRSGTTHRVQEKGSEYPESVTFQSDGNTTWVKVFPFKYGDKNTVTLYAENALDVQVSQKGVDLFPAPYATTSAPAGIQTSPLPLVMFIGAIVLGTLVFLRRQ